MTKTKSTKRALLLSALSLLMCVSMLIGSTFAWFTDTTSSAVNTIQAGKLDVVLEKMETGGSWSDASTSALGFRDGTTGEAIDAADILWEPGCTYYTQFIRVRNAGNLALSYSLAVSGGNGSTASDTADLWDALEISYAIVEPGTTVPGVKATVSNGIVKGELKSEEHSTQMYIIIHMKESAGNKYQGLSLNNITVTVTAQQLSYEKDSIGDHYDANVNGLMGAGVGYISNRMQIGVSIEGLTGITSTDSFYINILDANGDVITTITPNQKVIDLANDGNLPETTACAIVYGEDSTSWDNTTFVPDVNKKPTTAVLFVDDVETGRCSITCDASTWQDVVNGYYSFVNP